MEIKRIVAHADFDGLVCALLLQEVLGIEDVVFAEAWEITEETFHVQHTDALADLPYAPCGVWFDHHASNAVAPGAHMHFDAGAKSCASLIYRHYLQQFPHLERFLPLVFAAEKIDMCEYTDDELRNPTPAMQVALSLDTEQYRAFLLQQLREHSLESIAALRIVQERYRSNMQAHDEFLAAIEEKSSMRGAVLVVDAQDVRFPRNNIIPFLLFLQHPHANASLIVFGSGPRLRMLVRENAAGTNTVDIGELMKQYGGGGHKAAGGCSIPAVQKEEIIDRILAVLNS
jgi:oligoribonuclease NrnB/cAMP/cGMP phosphodiesterase (DHH superfamily)